MLFPDTFIVPSYVDNITSCRLLLLSYRLLAPYHTTSSASTIAFHALIHIPSMFFAPVCGYIEGVMSCFREQLGKNGATAGYRGPRAASTHASR